MAKKATGHIISHTHWDREWRVPEWNSRWRLIKMMDRLLEKLESNSDFIFLFDGQVVSIHDYIEMCPEKKGAVEKFIQNGQLQIGPWYNLPDLYPVCGEALIRNLLIGINEAEKMGACLKIGYTTFGWGQTAQFPQIFKGFGINEVVVGKNVSKERAPNSEFSWQAPDGTEVFSTRLGVEKRANFFFSAVMPATYGYNYSDNNTKVNWGENGWIFHSVDSFTDSELTFIPDKTFHPEMVDSSMEEVWNTCKDSLVQEHLFMGNGCDSTAPNDVVDKIIDHVNTHSKDKKLVYSQLETYFNLIQKSIKDNGIELKTVHGELRDGPVHALSANALATRMPLKILNRKAQDQLIRYAEPFAVLAEILGAEYPRQFLNKAWNFLLLAHSHDAINGVTLDKTAEDTTHKLKQVIEIGQVVTDMAATEILKKVNLNSFEKEDILLAVFNPSPQPKKQIVEVVIDVPEEKPCRRLKAFDSEGIELSVQNKGHSTHAAPVCVENSRALPFYSDRHNIHLETGEIPAYGYKIIKIVTDEPYNRKLMFWHGTFEQGTQVTEPLAMENKYLKVKINADGTYNLTSNDTNQSFKNIGYYEDSGDVGDYWQRVKPQYDKVIYSKGKSTNIYLKEDGPLSTTYVCECIMKVPTHADYQPKFASKRAENAGMIKISTELTLKADSPFLEVKVLINNQAKDHRLRVAIPTQINTDESHAMGHFNVDTRKIGRDYKNGVRDGEMSTLPMQNFVDLSDGVNGLAILNKELLEFEVTEDPGRTALLTLLRCMEVKICTEGRCATVEHGAEGPQCLGNSEFNFALFPHKGNWQDANVYDVTEKYLLQPRAYQISKHNNGTLPDKLSMFSIDSPAIQLASLKKSLDKSGIITRLYNATSEDVRANVKFDLVNSDVYLVNLKEELIDAIKRDALGSISLDIEANKIMSVLWK